MQAVARTDDLLKVGGWKWIKRRVALNVFLQKKTVNLPNVLSFHVVYLSIKFNIWMLSNDCVDKNLNWCKKYAKQQTNYSDS